MKKTPATIAVVRVELNSLPSQGSNLLSDASVCRPAMETKQIGPDGEPAVFDSGIWFSSDGRYQWDGSDWVRSHRASSGLSFAHVGFAGMFIAVIAYAAYTLVNTGNSAFN